MPSRTVAYKPTGKGTCEMNNEPEYRNIPAGRIERSKQMMQPRMDGNHLMRTIYRWVNPDGSSRAVPESTGLAFWDMADELAVYKQLNTGLKEMLEKAESGWDKCSTSLKNAATENETLRTALEQIVLNSLWADGMDGASAEECWYRCRQIAANVLRKVDKVTTDRALSP